MKNIQHFLEEVLGKILKIIISLLILLMLLIRGVIKIVIQPREFLASKPFSLVLDILTEIWYLELVYLYSVKSKTRIFWTYNIFIISIWFMEMIVIYNTNSQKIKCISSLIYLTIIIISSIFYKMYMDKQQEKDNFNN